MGEQQSVGTQRAGRSKGGLLGRWIRATAGAWAIGMPISYLLGVESRISPLLLAALLVGLLQWLVLRRRTPRAGWWIAATVGGAGVGNLIWLLLPQAGLLPPVLAGALAITALQWQVLRQSLRPTGWWIAAGVATNLVLGLAVVALPMIVWFFSSRPINQVNAFFGLIILGAVLGAAAGLITGLALSEMVGRPGASEGVGAQDRGRRLAMGVIVTVVGLPLVACVAVGYGLALPLMSQEYRAEQELATGILATIGTLDARLGAIREVMAVVADPSTATGANVAGLHARLAELPLPGPEERRPAASIELRQTGGMSGFYVRVGEVDAHTVDLLGVLDRLVKLTPDQRPLIDYYRCLAGVDLRLIANSSQRALFEGTMTLEHVSRRPELQLSELEPVTASGTAVYAERNRLKDADDALRAERKALVIEGGLLGAPYQIGPDDTPDQVIAIARELRQQGAITQADALFAQYGERFASDWYAAPGREAADYATMAQAFTRQIDSLGVTGGVYVWQIIPKDDRAVRLQEGDIVIAINGQPVRDKQEFEDLWIDYHPGNPFRVTVLRLGAGAIFATLNLEGESIPFVESLPI